MRCPTCPSVDLLMTHRDGVEIDYCPKCRGVWLDRGELDKIIDRAGSAQPAAPPASAPVYAPYGAPPPDDRHAPARHDQDHASRHAPARRRDDDDDDDNDDSKHAYRYQDPSQPRRKKNWLGEIFDVF